MNRYIALLRGINVGGHRKIKMAELKTLFQSIGFGDVQTYIQSGNVVFSSQDTSQLAQRISTAIGKEKGWEVPVVVLSVAQLRAIMENCPFGQAQRQESYFALLHAAADAARVAELNAVVIENEQFHYSDACVYFYCVNGYRNSTLNNNWLEKKLRVAATTRNYKTMHKLLELTTV